jgi:hypothetical protein
MDESRFGEIMDCVVTLFQRNLTEEHREHLHHRYGLTDETISRYRIGYAPLDRNQMVLNLFEHGFSGDEMAAAGLVTRTPETNLPLWQGRLMFPYLVGGAPMYLIGRRTDETNDGGKGKYKKQRRTGVAAEPIFGLDSVVPGKPVIVTEGVTDAIIAQQAGYACVSPVTTRFKEEHAPLVVEACRRAGRVYIIMDSETDEAGLRGAVSTGMEMVRRGLYPYLGLIPRPDDIDKIDLNDYVRGGGSIEDLMGRATYIEDHPLAETMRLEAVRRAAQQARATAARQRIAARAKPRPGGEGMTDGDVLYAMKDRIIASIPPLSALTGVDGHGPHPIYGSTTGSNLSVTGNQWYCWHAGSQGGGGPLEWIAVYELRLIREGEPLRGAAFMAALKHAADAYLPDWRERAKRGK